MNTTSWQLVATEDLRRFATPDGRGPAVSPVGHSAGVPGASRPLPGFAVERLGPADRPEAGLSGRTGSPRPRPRRPRQTVHIWHRWASARAPGVRHEVWRTAIIPVVRSEAGCGRVEGGKTSSHHPGRATESISFGRRAWLSRPLHPAPTH